MSTFTTKSMASFCLVKQEGSYHARHEQLHSTDPARATQLLCGMSIRAVTGMTISARRQLRSSLWARVKRQVWYQDRLFQTLSCKRLQIDEIWGFVGAKAKTRTPRKRLPARPATHSFGSALGSEGYDMVAYWRRGKHAQLRGTS
jgi:hypothetical protein